MSSKPIYSPHTEKILNALQYQGMTNNCGPFTTATILNALRGLEILGDQLALEMNRPVWRGPLFVVRRVENWATFPWGMADVMREHGLTSSWRLFTNPETLKEYLEQGRVLMPMIGEWKPLWAHVMTLVAWDPDKGWGFADTRYTHHDLTWESDERFRRYWRATGRLLVMAY